MRLKGNLLMGDVTGISWCDHTHNSWWGCLEVSPGCEKCYARILAERFGHAVWGAPRDTERMITSNANWRKPLVWNARAAANDTNWDDKTWRPAVRGGQRRLVFSASMSDVFEWHPQLDLPRQRLWKLIEDTPYLDWLLLTKRPMNIKRMLPKAWLDDPRPNVWLGTSAEDQERADLRIPYLLDVPAVVHFISAEPLLGPIDFGDYLGPERINWVITGGESGAGHRPMDPKWVEDIDAQCDDAAIAHFFKQHGGRRPGDGGCLLFDMEVKQFPTPLDPQLLSRAS